MKPLGGMKAVRRQPAPRIPRNSEATLEKSTTSESVVKHTYGPRFTLMFPFICENTPGRNIYVQSTELVKWKSNQILLAAPLKDDIQGA